MVLALAIDASVVHAQSSDSGRTRPGPEPASFAGDRDASLHVMLTGRVVQTDGKPVAQANVAPFDTTDSAV